MGEDTLHPVPYVLAHLYEQTASGDEVLSSLWLDCVVALRYAYHCRMVGHKCSLEQQVWIGITLHDHRQGPWRVRRDNVEIKFELHTERMMVVERREDDSSVVAEHSYSQFLERYTDREPFLMLPDGQKVIY